MKTAWVSLAILGSILYWVGATPAIAEVLGGVDFNVTKKNGPDGNCAITKNPQNKRQLFAACNTDGPGLFAARSNDLGETWIYYDATDKTIADGTDGFFEACCDPTVAWDGFNNLYLGYVGVDRSRLDFLFSNDGGRTFLPWTSWVGWPGWVFMQPTLVVGENVGGTPNEIWVVFNRNGHMEAAGTLELPSSDRAFAHFYTTPIPGTTDCNFGDIAISPSGAVVQVCQTPTGGEGPTSILVNTDPDGLGPMPFGPPVLATMTNVGARDLITPQGVYGVDAEAGLAYDRFGPGGLPGFPGPSPHLGRLYLVYTDEVVDESNDTDIMVRFSDDDGMSWSPSPIRVNDDSTDRSQFLPKIATNRLSGNIAICWLDARDSAMNDAVRQTCSMATPTSFPTFFANEAISDAASISTGSGDEFGDYAGLTYFQGRLHPMWADTSNSTGDNPDLSADFDAYTDVVGGGLAAMEGDPHITTLDGVRYDFQGAGEFVALRGDGLEIQVRHRAIATSSVSRANAHTGIATCVSLNSAVAARMGPHRVSYQPDISGIPDPSGLQLRVDGVLTDLGPSGLDFGDDGRIVKSAIADHGIEIGFPNGTTLMVTPNYWAPQKQWFMNVNVYNTTAAEGIMGEVRPDRQNRWLPLLPDGTSLGSRPFDLSERYDVLYDKFGEAWRVDDSTSLFDYAPGTSTSDFTLSGWPHESPPCDVPPRTPVTPLDLATAEAACAAITEDGRRADCVFDVQLTGELSFAKTYLLTQQLEAGATTVTVSDDLDTSRFQDDVTFVATVVRTAARGRDKPKDTVPFPNDDNVAVGLVALEPNGRDIPTGTVQFTLDGNDVGGPITLDPNGRATWIASALTVGDHEVAASYSPPDGSVYLTSSSQVKHHTVAAAESDDESRKSEKSMGSE